MIKKNSTPNTKGEILIQNDDTAGYDG